jgi:hypothetical protein
MLINCDSGEIINYIPHIQDFNTWKKRLSAIEYDRIVEEINKKIEGNEINVAGWLPGPDWSGTPFYPIYINACKQNYEHSAMFFGLLVWEAMMNRPEKWGFGKGYEAKGVLIRSMVYFLIP